MVFVHISCWDVEKTLTHLLPSGLSHCEIIPATKQLFYILTFSWWSSEISFQITQLFTSWQVEHGMKYLTGQNSWRAC